MTDYTKNSNLLFLESVDGSLHLQCPQSRYLQQQQQQQQRQHVRLYMPQTTYHYRP